MTSRQTSTIFLSLIILGLGYWLYASSAAQYDQCQSTLGGLAQTFSKNAAAQCGDISTRHFGSIGIMGLGAILFLLGLLGSSQRSK
jgi:hypothetical protein